MAQLPLMNKSYQTSGRATLAHSSTMTNGIGAIPSSSRGPSEKHWSPTREETVCWSNCSHENKQLKQQLWTVPLLLRPDAIHAFCLEVYTWLSPPRQWITYVLIPLPKKGVTSRWWQKYTVEAFPSCPLLQRCTIRSC